jgi:hypothetical protein
MFNVRRNAPVVVGNPVELVSPATYTFREASMATLGGEEKPELIP